MAAQTDHHASHTSLGDQVSYEERTFHPFTKFPGEIQLKIWKAALPGPRVIEIMATKRNIKLNEKQIREREKAGLGTSQAHFRVFEARLDHSELLPLLYACYDSRAVVLKSYRMSFKLSDFLRPFYFDHRQDTIVVSRAKTFHGFTNVIKYLSQESVQFLALDSATIPVPFLRCTAAMTKDHEDQVVRKDMLSKIVESFATLQTLLICYIDSPLRSKANKGASDFGKLIQESMSKMEARAETSNESKNIRVATDGKVEVDHRTVPKIVQLPYKAKKSSSTMNREIIAWLRLKGY